MRSLCRCVLLFATIALATVALPKLVAAQEVDSPAFSEPSGPMAGGAVLGTGSLVGFDPVISSFDPGDPRVGIPLGLAYAPSPLFLAGSLVTEPELQRVVNITELVAGAVGSVVSAFAMNDALARDAQADIAIHSMATAHALSWNLQLVVRSVLRLVVGRMDGPLLDTLVPLISPFPLRGGVGIAPRWMW